MPKIFLCFLSLDLRKSHTHNVKVHIYLEHHSVCPLVLHWDPPPPPEQKGEGTQSPASKGVGAGGGGRVPIRTIGEKA
jgi:hypothetical protein